MNEPGASAPEQAIHSTSQIQSAVDQLTYLHRILHGDDDMSLSDLLASTSASGPSSSLPSGGLAKALPALVSPLLPGDESAMQQYAPGMLSQSQGALLVKRAAFQPRRYLAMTAELVARTSDDKGEMYRAIQLAQSLMGPSHSTSIKQRQREALLHDRKRRRGERPKAAKPSQDEEDGGAPTRKRFNKTLLYAFPSALHGQAREAEPSLTGEPDSERTRMFLEAWESELLSVDMEASRRIQATLQQWTSGKRGPGCLIRVRIEEVGVGWVWVHFAPVQQTGWTVRIHRVSVLAESEVDEARDVDSLALALQTSRYPLYRRISSLLHTKLISLTVQPRHPWSHLITALFALTTLCRLHELHVPAFPLVSGTTLRGQENILNGFIHLDTVAQDDEADLHEGTSEEHSVQ